MGVMITKVGFPLKNRGLKPSINQIQTCKLRRAEQLLVFPQS